MLEVSTRESCAISEIERKSDGLYLKSEYGLLRLSPVSDSIIRISFTRRDAFEENYGIGILPHANHAKWDYSEHEGSVYLETACLKLDVNRKSGSIKYYGKDGKLLLAEREQESRTLEEFDSYKTIIDENTVIEEIETPDGLKRKIKEATRVFDRKLYRTRLYLEWQDDEKLYGLGQTQEGVLNLRGTTQYLHQANMKIAIPMLVSTKGYGILMATGSPVIFSDTHYGSYLYAEASVQMDFYFIAGENFDEIIKGYRFLTGKAVMLPLWAFGFIQSQERYKTQQEILDIVKKHRERNIGLDCIVLDWCSWKGNLWGQKTMDPERFPSPEKMMDELHRQNVHFMISLWPNMNEASDNYNEFFERGLLLPASNIYDAYRQEARELYWNQAKEGLFDKGIDAWWCDSSEPFTPEWSHKGEPEASSMYHEFVTEASKYIPVEKCNTYSLFHANTMYEGQRRTDPSKRVVNLTRSTYTGGQRYGVIAWSGDISATWKVFRRQIAAGLNYCVTGLPYWTLDIGAFFVKRGKQWFWNGDYEKGTCDLGYRELFTRWFQMGAFLPVFRSHGTDVRREIWNFGEPGEMFYDALIAMNQLRYRLLPYIYSCAGAVWHDDATIMRMLAFDFASDEAACEIDDEYLFGDSILVCPVTEPMYYVKDSRPVNNEKKRRVYLPKGANWYDFWTDKFYSGGQWIDADAPIDRIPLFVREGSIIPMTEALTSTAQLKYAPVKLHIYAEDTAHGRIYEDAGDGYSYEQGEYAYTALSWEKGASKVQARVVDGKMKPSRDYTECEIVLHSR
ncbi:MAG TPA: glycoside hydrolase family 31 protein [Thermoclostridium sp.]